MAVGFWKTVRKVLNSAPPMVTICETCNLVNTGLPAVPGPKKIELAYAAQTRIVDNSKE